LGKGGGDRIDSYFLADDDHFVSHLLLHFQTLSGEKVVIWPELLHIKSLITGDGVLKIGSHGEDYA